MIYDAYHEDSAEVKWESDSVVVINGKRLDLSKGEKYSWKHKYKVKIGTYKRRCRFFYSYL